MRKCHTKIFPNQQKKKKIGKMAQKNWKEPQSSNDSKHPRPSANPPTFASKLLSNIAHHASFIGFSTESSESLNNNNFKNDFGNPRNSLFSYFPTQQPSSFHRSSIPLTPTHPRSSNESPSSRFSVNPSLNQESSPPFELGIPFSKISLLKDFPEKITGIALKSHLFNSEKIQFYLGTETGYIISFSFPNKLRELTSEMNITCFQEDKILVGNTEVSNLVLVEHYDALLFLCAGKISTLDISSYPMKITRTVPLNEVSRFCCKIFDASRSLDQITLSICAIVREPHHHPKLFVTQFENKFNFKEYIIPSEPLSVVWYDDQIILGFVDGYYALLLNNFGKTMKLELVKEKVPLIKFLPHQKYLIKVHTTGLFKEKNGKTYSSIQFSNFPIAFGYVFPYIFSLNQENLEIIDFFHSNLFESIEFDKPHFLVDNNRSILVGSHNQIWFIYQKPSSLHYQYGDLNLYKNVVKELTEEFISNFISQLDSPNNAFHLLYHFFATKFLDIYSPIISNLPSSVSQIIENIKLDVTQYNSRVHSQMISTFQELFYYNNILFLDIVHWSLFASRLNFLSHIQRTVLILYRKKFETEDGSYARSIDKLRNSTMVDVGVEKNFWLTSESLQGREIVGNNKNEPTKHQYFWENPKYRPYESAIRIIRQLPDSVTPREKLFCVVNFIKTVNACVEEFWTEASNIIGPTNSVVVADALIPILIYLLIQAQVPNIHSEINYLIDLIGDDVLNGIIGYSLVSLQTSVLAVHELEGAEKLDSNPENKGHPTPEFQIPKSEKLINRFSCSFQFQRGFLYVFSNHLCFETLPLFPSKKIVIPLSEIISVAKKESLLIFNYIIEITLASGKKYFFDQFIFRDRAFDSIKATQSKSTTTKTPSKSFFWNFFSNST